MEILSKVVKVPCSVIEEGAIEVEVDITTRVVLAVAFVSLGEVLATLVLL